MVVSFWTPGGPWGPILDWPTPMDWPEMRQLLRSLDSLTFFPVSAQPTKKYSPGARPAGTLSLARALVSLVPSIPFTLFLPTPVRPLELSGVRSRKKRVTVLLPARRGPWLTTEKVSPKLEPGAAVSGGSASAPTVRSALRLADEAVPMRTTPRATTTATLERSISLRRIRPPSPT